MVNGKMAVVASSVTALRFVPKIEMYDPGAMGCPSVRLAAFTTLLAVMTGAVSAVAAKLNPRRAPNCAVKV